MSSYAIVRNPHGSGYLIDSGSGTSIRYPTKRQAQMVIDRWIRQEAREIEFAAANQAARRARVAAYLAARAERRAIAAGQLAFAF